MTKSYNNILDEALRNGPDLVTGSRSTAGIVLRVGKVSECATTFSGLWERTHAKQDQGLAFCSASRTLRAKSSGIPSIRSAPNAASPFFLRASWLSEVARTC